MNAAHKDLCLQILASNSSVDEITFFSRKEPELNAHILLRLEYKNDNSIRIMLKFKNGFTYAHRFNKIESIPASVGYVSWVYAISGEAPKSEAVGSWLDMNQTVFRRRELQKLLNFK